MADDKSGKRNWRRWGPYVSERQWGTVREDYSPGGTAWEYFPHDHARSRAYRWGEDGIAGFSDDHQHFVSRWPYGTGRDPILKERLFGLTNSEGNHGEDVKELYYYLDATPSHSYLKMLYKYPQAEFPYARLVEENRPALLSADQPEFELLDTGFFDEDRYFDVFVEYAKAAPEDILMLVTIHNRGPEAAKLFLCCRNYFSATAGRGTPDCAEAIISAKKAPRTKRTMNSEFGNYCFDCDGYPECSFARTKQMSAVSLARIDATGFFKDAFHEYMVAVNKSAVIPRTTPAPNSARFIISPSRRAAPSHGPVAARQNPQRAAPSSPTSIPIFALRTAGSR